MSAAALRGPRDSIPQALRFDSDGTPNDSRPNPANAQAPVVVLRTLDQVRDLRPADVEGKIVFLN